jgi:hypothetical protein
MNMHADYGPTEPLPGKGVTRCNRMACQVELDETRMWNTVTQAWYCRACGTRINLSSHLCIPVAEHAAISHGAS